MLYTKIQLYSFLDSAEVFLPYGPRHAKRGPDQPAQSDQGLRFSLTESSDTIEFIKGEQMPG